jgi:subtilisin family serine protease
MPPSCNAPRRIRLAIAFALLGAAGVPATAGAATAPTAATTPSIVVLKPSAATTASVVTRLESRIGVEAQQEYFSALRGFAATLTSAQITALRADSSVATVLPDPEIQAAGKPAKQAPAQVLPAGVARVGGGHRAASGAVAVVDTGLDLANPDLDAVDGVNCIKPGKPAQDDNGHGTHVGGTIGARDNDIGAVGVAPGTPLVAVKVLANNNKGRLSGLLCGIDWITSHAAAVPGVRPAIRVANISIASAGTGADVPCPALGDALHSAICGASAAGILVVAAAGNGGVNFRGTVPAAYDDVLAATAMTDTDGLPGGFGPAPAGCKGEYDDTPGTYSNFFDPADTAAAAHTLSAPGTCVVSTKLGGGTATMEGTSMAAPHIAAAAALCLGTAAGPGPCAGLATDDAIRRLVGDGTAAAPALGFAGDPLAPLGSRGTGPLVTAAAY